MTAAGPMAADTFAGIPEELRARPQWLAWWSVQGHGQPVRLPIGKLTKPLKAQAKPHKLPINPHDGGLAATTRPATWASFEVTQAAVDRWSVSGVGFVFTDSDPYAGVDIDNCRAPETGDVTAWAWKIIHALDSYTEVSPSGTGVHTIVRGQLPTGQGNQKAVQGGKVEMFSRARYFTFTGLRVEGTPADIRDRQAELLELHQQLFTAEPAPKPSANVVPTVPAVGDEELIENARRARNGLEFDRLWDGLWEGDHPSQSEADYALCRHLAFWTGNDAGRIDRLFRQSALMRGKWNRDGYRARTIQRAIKNTSQTWSPPAASGNRRAELGSGQRQKDARIGWQPPVPFTCFDLPFFPTSAFPGWLRDFVEAVATATQTPADLAAMLALSVLATACAKKVSVRVSESYEEPVNIYTATALAPGNRKSAVFSLLTQPIVECEASEVRRNKVAIAQQQAAKKAKEAALRIAQEQAGKARPADRQRASLQIEQLAAELADMPEPVATRLIVDDCTPEKLSSILQSQDGRIAVLSAEGDVFDLMAGRYSPNRTANFGVFLRGHSGDQIRVDRVGRPPEFVTAPAITMGVTVQPEVITGLAAQPGFRGRGLLGRIFYSLPKSLLGSRQVAVPPIDESIRAQYAEKVFALLLISIPKDDAGAIRPHALTLTPEARQAMQQFAQWVEPQLAEFGAMGAMTDWGGKLVGGVYRIAGLLHMAANIPNEQEQAPWKVEITDETVQQAIRIGKYLVPHAKAAFALMATDEVLERVKAILRWLEHSRMLSFSRRDAHQAMRGTFKRAAETDAPLALLIDHAYIRQIEENSLPGPGRSPSPVYEVNPLSVPSRSGNCEDSE